jgi:hypothetical protein
MRTIPTGDPAPTPHEEIYALARDEHTPFM